VQNRRNSRFLFGPPVAPGIRGVGLRSVAQPFTLPS
jgi:hypothetical protein